MLCLNTKIKVNGSNLSCHEKKKTSRSFGAQSETRHHKHVGIGFRVIADR
jgi:hypothetical protein